MVLFQGQSMDIFWTYNGHCPDLEQYYRMVNQSKLQRKRAWTPAYFCEESAF